MAKLTLKDLDVAGRRALVRVDFNVPLDNDQNVTDATRIKAALPTIQYLLDKGAAVVLMSHLGRPQGNFQENLSLRPCIAILEGLLHQKVHMAPGVISEESVHMATSLPPKEVLLLENLRFFRAEEHPDEDPSFAKTLASLGDVFVNDAFGTAHRVHSSTVTIAQYFPNKAAAGLLMNNEIHFLGEAVNNPKRPFVALIGGAKVSSKIGILTTLIEKVDALFVGGAMAFTFLKAQGINVGNSLVEEPFISVAKDILEKRPTILHLPKDVVVAQEMSEKASVSTLSLKEGIPQGFMGLDIGPETVKDFSSHLNQAKTIIWNGPLGVYELPPFSKGTNAMANTLGNVDATTIVGGGDLIAAVNKAGVANKITHVSTGGGASLKYLEKGTLPAIEALSDKK